MAESYDDLVNAVALRWIELRSQLDGATNAQILDFILAELERNDLKLRTLDMKAEKIIAYMRIFGKNDIEVIRNLRKVKINPRLPIKKELPKKY